jgi:hypothetical protein
MGRRIKFDADDLEWERSVPETHSLPCPSGKGKMTESQAAHAAKNGRKQSRDPFIENYLCDLCGAWHIGHKIGTQRLREDLKRYSL